MSGLKSIQCIVAKQLKTQQHGKMWLKTYQN
ncbi:hypothetical protein Gotri_018919, partial [Gossypium trilobum]|nr:hypothetical protein [Gossypium trilobum]